MTTKSSCKYYGIWHTHRELCIPAYMFSGGDIRQGSWIPGDFGAVPALYTTEDAAEYDLLRFLLAQRNFRLSQFEIIEVTLSLPS